MVTRLANGAIRNATPTKAKSSILGHPSSAREQKFGLLVLFQLLGEFLRWLKVAEHSFQVPMPNSP